MCVSVCMYVCACEYVCVHVCIVTTWGRECVCFLRASVFGRNCQWSFLNRHKCMLQNDYRHAISSHFHAILYLPFLYVMRTFRSTLFATFNNRLWCYELGSWCGTWNPQNLWSYNFRDLVHLPIILTNTFPFPHSSPASHHSVLYFSVSTYFSWGMVWSRSIHSMYS